MATETSGESSVTSSAAPERIREISVVVPVYRGAETIGPLAAELDGFRTPRRTPGGRLFRVSELVLVWDRGPDRSDVAIRALAAEHDWVRPVWLSRNFGQHAATVAGMTATGSEWIVTMDEDGQHDPAAIGDMLDVALDERAMLVYASPTNNPPHSFFRNIASWTVKTVFLKMLTNAGSVPFHSFRLLSGEAGRSAAAYAGRDVYLDIALGWVVASVRTCPVAMRNEGREASNYRTRALLSHFWRLVLSSGTRPLRLVSAIGVVTALTGVVLAAWLVYQRIVGITAVSGWTSAVVAQLLIGGLILFSLGVIAEYVGMAASMSMGKPMYVSVSDPMALFDDEPASGA